MVLTLFYIIFHNKKNIRKCAKRHSNYKLS